MVKEILALIPARGGSKGIPGKNIKSLGGSPLIAYSIASARQSRKVTRVIVTTDDDQIAATARSFGAEVPFLRPAEYARDDTQDLPVFQHALRWLEENESYQPDLVVQLRPTSPFRPHGMVDEAVDVFQNHPDATSVRGVIPSGQNPYKMWRFLPEGRMVPLLETEYKEAYNMPRQALPGTYWQTGHIDVIAPGTIQAGSMSGPVIYPYLIHPRFKVDLDNLLDWEQAEWRIRDLRDDIVCPGYRFREQVGNVELVVLDFDGVLTDNRVFVDQDGKESVAAHRGDGMGIGMLKKEGIRVMILSKETNPVVSARARKLDIPVMQGIDHKGMILKTYLEEQKIDPGRVIYVGNDVNDLPCFELVGMSCAVADAHPEVLSRADRILSAPGGMGAVRELCDLILQERK